MRFHMTEVGTVLFMPAPWSRLLSHWSFLQQNLILLQTVCSCAVQKMWLKSFLWKHLPASLSPAGQKFMRIIPTFVLIPSIFSSSVQLFFPPGETPWQILYWTLVVTLLPLLRENQCERLSADKSQERWCFSIVRYSPSNCYLTMIKRSVILIAGYFSYSPCWKWSSNYVGLMALCYLWGSLWLICPHQSGLVHAFIQQNEQGFYYQGRRVNKK